MDAVIFNNCRFMGEEVCFTGAKFKDVVFINCEIEDYPSWVMYSDQKNVERILHIRGAIGDYAVLC